jgi:hypothetical protein
MGGFKLLKKCCLKIGYNVSLISVDFPLPETPEMQAKIPNGICIETLFRLLPEAPFKTKYFPDPALLT